MGGGRGPVHGGGKVTILLFDDEIIAQENVMDWHTYEIAPIDFGWENLKTVQETAAALLEKSESSTCKNDIDSSELQAFLRSWETAKDAASKSGWEGDFRDQPVVIWIPAETEFSYGFVFKQENNGTTYIISPVEMPWLGFDQKI